MVLLFVILLVSFEGIGWPSTVNRDISVAIVGVVVLDGNRRDSLVVE